MSKKLPNNMALIGIIEELGEVIIYANGLLQKNQALTQEELRLVISKFAKVREVLCKLSMELGYESDNKAIPSNRELIGWAIEIVKLANKIF